MTSKARKFLELVDRGWPRRKALRKAGYRPGSPHSAASLACALLAGRYGEKPRGYEKLTPELQTVWQGLTQEEKTGLEALRPEDGTLESNLKTLGGFDPPRPKPPALPLPSPPPAPLPDQYVINEVVHQYGYVDPPPATECGLPMDFILGLQQTAYLDRPVEEGIWESGVFRSRDDLINEAYRARQDANPEPEGW